MSGKTFEILLVEDNPSDTALALHVLRECRTETHVSHVEDGIECLRFLRHEPPYAQAPRPNLILLDLNLPRLDGLKTLTAIKQDEALRPIPIVVLTTSDSEGDVVRSYSLGANSFITKPMDLDQFVTVLRAVENYWFHLVTLPSEN